MPNDCEDLPAGSTIDIGPDDCVLIVRVDGVLDIVLPHGDAEKIEAGSPELASKATCLTAYLATIAKEIKGRLFGDLEDLEPNTKAPTGPAS